MNDQIDLFAASLSKHAIVITDEARDRLADYARLLWEWNAKLNLTRHTDYEKFVTRDVFDAVQLAGMLKEGEEVADLGTGGGMPGILLAILRPDLQLSLTESVGKKARAVEDIVGELDLPVTVFHARLEELLDDFRFDAVVARAVGPLWKMCFWLKDHWPMVGRLLAIKGPNWIAERNDARHRGLLGSVELRRARAYCIPGTEVESVILKLWTKGLPEP